MDKKWLLQLNEEKCKVLHLGRGYPASQYHIGNTALSTTEAEKDLGVYVISLPVKAKSMLMAADGLKERYGEGKKLKHYGISGPILQCISY